MWKTSNIPASFACQNGQQIMSQTPKDRMQSWTNQQKSWSDSKTRKIINDIMSPVASKDKNKSGFGALTQSTTAPYRETPALFLCFAEVSQDQGLDESEPNCKGEDLSVITMFAAHDTCFFSLLNFSPNFSRLTKKHSWGEFAVAPGNGFQISWRALSNCFDTCRCFEKSILCITK